jgi:hypothetical protein
MAHKNKKTLQGIVSDLKGRLLLVALVLTGFAAQLAMIGPTRAPDSIARDNEENIAGQSQAANVAVEDHKKLKRLKVVPSNSPSTNQPHDQNNTNPSIQGNPNPAASSSSSNHKKNQPKSNQNNPEKTTQRCLLFGRILCN